LRFDTFKVPEVVTAEPKLTSKNEKSRQMAAAFGLESHLY
jgi:hypothetical protein